MSFTLDIDQFTKTVALRYEVVIRTVTLSVVSEVIARSPVDTGRFRGNWQVGLGAANLATTQEVDKGGGGTIARAASRLAAWVFGRRLAPILIVISNNLPYAKRLENGWSQQAPTGMVAVTVAQFSAFFAGAVAAARRVRA